MHLKNLSLLNFKNYQEASFEFSPQINCLTGNNGSGKTNVLDAVYYLSFCKSYFNPVDSQNISHGENFFVVNGLFERDGDDEKVYCGVKRGKKKVFKRNDAKYDKLMDHIGLYPAVIISPYDSDIVNEGSDVRRKLIDGIISQYDKSYLEALLKYQKVLLNRNRLLKYFWENRTFDQDQIDVWDEKMVEYGEVIYTLRKKFVEEFLPLFTAMYSSISGGAEDITVEYYSQLDGGDFADLLKSGLAKDRHRNHSTIGLHKDDLVFSIAGHPVKKFASQGQQKSLIIALKLAQFEHISAKMGVKPMLLLDDIFDKIDGLRLEHILKLVVEERFGQIFITDTDEDRIMEAFNGLDVKVHSFKVEKGELI